MGALSVLLNIFTLLVVGIVLYMGYNLYRTRPDMNATPTDVFNQMLVEPGAVSHAYFTGPALGPIGDFADYDWDRVDSANLDEE
jgi:hypothetical protein